MDNKSEYQKALDYHSGNQKGKISIMPTKKLETQKDLALAYSPHVAAPCLEIQKDSNKIYEYTARGNMVAVISNGSAVLGLGPIGPAAAKPVMEGKSVLFKKFADIDSIDLEVATQDVDEFITVVKNLSYSFGGINLEDIKAPECFIIEKKLQELMDIPVFHDDQHGTAIISAAGLINASIITKKKLKDLKIVVNGAGAAAISCLDLLVSIGVDANNIILCDSGGVIYKGRKERMNQWKEKYAANTQLRSLKDAMRGADVFLGLSVAGVVTKDMVSSMAESPIIFAMANPDPEISPEDVKSVRSDAIIATGRSDYPNQVNNVMGFPYIFRGALDVRASTVNMEMKKAAAFALAELARLPVPSEVYKAYPGRSMSFGKEYIIPVPFDPRLISAIPLSVAKAAIETKVSRLPEFDLNKYKSQLKSRFNPVSSHMNFIFDKISRNPQRIIFAEGEEEEIIKAAIIMRDESYAKPIIVGDASKINDCVAKIEGIENLSGIEITNSSKTDKLEKYIDFLYSKLQRKGYLRRDCARLVKRDRNIFSAIMLALGDADCMITGINKNYFSNYQDIIKIIDPEEGKNIFGYCIVSNEKQNIIIADSAISEVQSAQNLAEIAIQSSQIARKIGLTPRVAMVSYSNFGNPEKTYPNIVRQATILLDERKVDFEYDGEISVDVALNAELQKLYPFCRLSKPANILIMPDLNSAAISTQLAGNFTKVDLIGPVLSGLSRSVQILQMGMKASDIVKMAGLAAYDSINNTKKE